MNTSENISSRFILILMLIFLCSPIDLNSQINETNSEQNNIFIEWANMPVYRSELNTVVKGSDGSWILGGVMDNPFSFVSPPIVIKMSVSGEIIWEKYPMGFSWEVGSTQVIANSSDGEILVAGSCMLGCDYGPSGVFIEKYTLSGQTTWKQKLINQNWDFGIHGIYELSTGEIIVITNRIFYKLSSSGDSILSVDYGFDYGNHIICGILDINQFLFGHDKFILKTDFDGKQLADYYFGSTVSEIHRFEESYFVIGENYLFKTDNEFGKQDSLNLSALVTHNKQTYFYDSACFLMDNDHIVHIDLNTFQSTIIEIEKPEQMIVNEIKVSDSTLIAAGLSIFKSNKAFSAKTWSLGGESENRLNDIGIKNLTIENARAELLWGTDEFYEFYWETTATIMNYGFDTINNCYIGGRLIVPNICGFNGYQGYFDQLNLAPGDSIDLYLGEMNDWGFYLPDTVNQTTYTLKLHSMIPNHKLDRNVENDESEVSFVIQIVDIDENSFNRLKTYPNPTNDKIIVKDFPVNSSWSLISVNGQEVKTGFADSNNFVIDISDLPPNIYMLNLTDNYGNQFINKILVY